jgi:steroid 5-alpha reductase family enzyme
MCVTLGLIWCIRLGIFLFIRFLQGGNDPRFDEIQNKPWALLSAYGAQIASILVTGIRFIQQLN